MVTTQIKGPSEDAVLRLRMLERNGLVERNVHPTVPPRVAYTLTGPGQGLRAAVDGMCDWTHRYFTHIDAARHRFNA